MELNGKQKRYLRSLAVNIRPIVQIGKGGLTNEILTSIRSACDARELLKVNILQNSDAERDDVADAIEEMDLTLCKSSDAISLFSKYLTGKKIARFLLMLKTC